MVEIYDGVHQTPNYTDNGIMFLSVENITKLKSSKFISEEAFKRDYKFYPQENDILMTRIGDVGTTNVVTDNSLKAYYVSLALLKYKSTNPFFLSSAIQSDFVQSGLANRTLKTAIPIKINKDEIGKVNVMLPLLKDEQELIGYCFHNLDHLITLHQSKSFECFFFDAACCTLSWEQRKLGELGTVITGNTPATVVKDYYTDDNEDGIVWVTPTDIVTNITSETEKRLTDLGQKVGRIVPANTILVTCIASIGKNTMLIDRGSFNQQINALIPNENKYEPYFLLTESFIWSHKMKTSASTGTMQIVNRMEFSEINTNVPNKNEQKSIGILFRTLDHLITLHQLEPYYRIFKAIAYRIIDYAEYKFFNVKINLIYDIIRINIA